jgi:hypothetical protein
MVLTLPRPVAISVRKQAHKRCVSISRFLANIVQNHCEDDEQQDEEQDEDCPCLTREELLKEMEKADRLEDCEVFNTAKELIASVHKDIHEACKNKAI